MPVSRPLGPAVRGGILLACCAATATAAVLGAGLTAASGAVSGTSRTVVASADTTPPSTPGGLTLGPTAYVNGTVSLAWTPSTDDVAVTGYEVYAWTKGATNDAFTRVTASVNTSSATQVTALVSGLTAGRDYLFYVVATDAAGNRSVPSLLARARAMTEPPAPSPSPGVDTTPPSAPYDLRSGTGPAPEYTALIWASDDPLGTATWYVFRRSSTAWEYAGYSALPRTMASILGDGPFTFQMVAIDAAGNISGPSNAVTVPGYPGSPTSQSPSPSASVTPSETPPSTCAVTYTAKSWPGGFTTDVVIKNTGSTPITGWRLQFAFPLDSQRVTTGWSATWAQSGTSVTATSLNWNKTIDPGQTVRIGFNGAYSGSANPSPTAFTLNGSACATG
ncbi:cellulose binding domain-containing protein [Microbispora sp. NPDC046973]|uniref:cellulose binding domain-containing protein n=1 Tax=Microbispora sp. NPDC046973 TaxID=3155022 RepID=UPI0033CC1A63